jgi:pyruvate kinase
MTASYLGNDLSELPRTKLVATVGPACREPAMLRKLIANGVDVFRLNMAHAEIEVHQQTVEAVRAAADAEGRPVGILVDLAGPKIRLGQLHTDPLTLELDQEISFVRGSTADRADELSCAYESLIDEVHVGNDIVLADGIARLRVVEIHPDRAVCKVTEAGTIRSRQGVNLPDTHLSVPAFGEQDRRNAAWASRAGVDFVSLSFVRRASEILDLKSVLEAAGSRAIVIAKIEKREALDELDSIIAAADGVMVARGDLGVEIDIEKTPVAQKRIIRACTKLGKPVIVATQMLESMHHSKQPTRAEVSDVANAILDGADACMLSGETAIGDYPVDSVRMMKRIMKETEELFRNRPSRVMNYESRTEWSIHDAVLLGAAQIAQRTRAKLVAMITSEPFSALVKSKQRDYVPTLVFTDKPQVAQQMTLFWGIVPLVVREIPPFDQLVAFINQQAVEKAGLAKDDCVVMILDNSILPGVHDTVVVSQAP